MFNKKGPAGKKGPSMNEVSDSDAQRVQDEKVTALGREITSYAKETQGSRFHKVLVDCTVHFVGMKQVDEKSVVKWFLYMRLLLCDLMSFLSGKNFEEENWTVVNRGVGSFLAYHGAIMAALCVLLDPTREELQNDDQIHQLVAYCETRASEKRATARGVTARSLKTYAMYATKAAFKETIQKLGFFSLYSNFVRVLGKFSSSLDVFLPPRFDADAIKGITFDSTSFTELRDHGLVLYGVLVGLFGEDFDAFRIGNRASYFIMEYDIGFFDWAINIQIFGEEDDKPDRINLVRARWQELIEKWFTPQ